jgi:hypothetical protein
MLNQGLNKAVEFLGYHLGILVDQVRISGHRSQLGIGGQIPIDLAHLNRSRLIFLALQNQQGHR